VLKAEKTEDKVQISRDIGKIIMKAKDSRESIFRISTKGHLTS